MSLHRMRVRAYLCGALAGAFSAVALLSRRESGRAAWLAAAAAVVCGALSVAFEAGAQGE